MGGKLAGKRPAHQPWMARSGIAQAGLFSHVFASIKGGAHGSGEGPFGRRTFTFVGPLFKVPQFCGTLETCQRPFPPPSRVQFENMKVRRGNPPPIWPLSSAHSKRLFNGTPYSSARFPVPAMDPDGPRSVEKYDSRDNLQGPAGPVGFLWLYWFRGIVRET